LLGLMMAGVYRLTFSGFTYERSFLITLATMPVIVAVVMSFIANNLALSLGMVGALSIIRFRTVIKDSRDMVFLFWTIAVGLGCGTGNAIAALAASIFLAGALMVLHAVRFGATRRSDYVLIIQGVGDDALAAARQQVSTGAAAAQMRSLEQDDDGWELVLELRLTDVDPADLPWFGDLRRTEGVGRVSLLAPQLSLPV
jgi:uncharacterized membrane protein YhiD involved in acid resistance